MTPEDIWHFRHTGFYRLPAPLPADLLRRLNHATRAEIAAMRQPLVWEKEKEGTPDGVRRLSKILERQTVFMEAATFGPLLEALAAVLGPDVELLHNKHNHLMVRPPGSAEVEWHSGEEPYHPRLVTALVYLEESTLENGCIRLVPGSHQRPFAWPRRPRQPFEDSPLHPRSLPVPMEAGGILLFDDCCFHGAGPNRSAGSRRSLTLAYQAHDVHAVGKDEPEKTLVRGERTYVGHPHPFGPPASERPAE